MSDDGVHILESVSRDAPDERVADLRRRIESAVDHFDRVEDWTVTVASLKPSREYVRDPIAAADPYNRIVYVPTDERLTDVTLFHELAHIDIRLRDDAGEDLPTTSEKFCSIYAVARMPVDRLDRGRIAYLGPPSAPREEWPEICRRGLEYRKDHHAYIQKTKEWLEI